MPRVVCAVDGGWEASHTAVQAAVAFCRERGCDLELVGVVKDSLLDSTRGTPGERMRRFHQVTFDLTRAVEIARTAGVETSTAVRAGDLVREVLAEARAAQAEEAFFARRHNRLTAALRGKPRIELEHVTLGPAKVAEAREKVA